MAGTTDLFNAGVNEQNYFGCPGELIARITHHTTEGLAGVLRA